MILLHYFMNKSIFFLDRRKSKGTWGTGSFVCSIMSAMLKSCSIARYNCCDDLLSSYRYPLSKRGSCL